jgi:hypothetical protein
LEVKRLLRRWQPCTNKKPIAESNAYCSRYVYSSRMLGSFTEGMITTVCVQAQWVTPNLELLESQAMTVFCGYVTTSGVR